jgi:pilus assembly protein FimV
MSRRFTRLFLLSVLLLSSEVWAIGLGDIKLDSALNEPLRAEIALLSASPDELTDLTVTLASAETFTRYGIDRPFYLQGIEFNVVKGGVSGSVVQVRSRAPITEPFLTFLVEATWSSGRLLREYTVLLDPPTYAPPAMQQAPAVSAPLRSTPSDSGRIERQSTPPPTAAPQARPTPRQVQQPAQTFSEPTPKPSLPDDDAPYDSAGGVDYEVVKGQTLWGVAKTLRPDARLTMNQTMLGIYQANPDAFRGNINELKAGAVLRVPSANEIFQISRGEAFREAQRQHSAWDGGVTAANYSAAADSTVSDSAASDFSAGGAEDVVADPVSRPNLTLVPPDEEPLDSAYDDATSYEPVSREDAIEERIAELESADVPNQQSLIEIRDNELATLRQELADIRGEIYEPPVDDTLDDALADEDAAATDIDDILADDEAVTEDTADAAADAVEETVAAAPSTRQSRSRDEGIVDKLISFLTGFWGIIIIALLIVAGGLFWFVRRGEEDDDENSGPWERLDSDEVAIEPMSATQTLQVPAAEETIVVVEQDSGVQQILEDTVEAPASDFAPNDEEGTSSGTFGSLEDTFSSETAVNMDQTDPIAEADFHMAYGLYDQAADLINGALESDPTDKSLMSKLCEVYFVWGNRDAFVGAAMRLKASVGDAASADWDKIVIMGQQIAADEAIFAGADLTAATQAVDLSFDDPSEEEAGALDMDFGDAADESGGFDPIDLGADMGDEIAQTPEAVDFDFDDESAAENDSSVIDFDISGETPALDPSIADATAEMPALNTPTIEEQFAGLDVGTSELPAIDESLHQAIADSGQSADETAEINLDDLDLGGAQLDATELASLDDLSDLEATGLNEELTDTGIREEFVDLTDEDLADETSEHPEVDLSASALVEGLDLSDIEESGMRLAADETGHNPTAAAESTDEADDIGFDQSLLDATGRTQVLSETFAVEPATDLDDADATKLASDLDDEDTVSSVSNDAETMLAPLDADDDDFDFAKTEALSSADFTGNTDLDVSDDLPSTGESEDVMSSVSSDAETMLAPLDDDDDFDFAKTEALSSADFAGNTDLDASDDLPSTGESSVDLDLEDLTAALQVSDIGDTLEQPRDESTVEQPRPTLPEDTTSVPTMSLAPEDMSDDLDEARTMTEVGTKLDLARAYVDMGDPAGARSILEEVLEEGDAAQRQQAQQLMDSLPS